MPDIKNMVWEETPIDVTSESNLIWSIANKLRGSYMCIFRRVSTTCTEF